MMKILMVSVFVVGSALGGRAGIPHPTQQRTLREGAIGADADALFGAMGGNAGLETAIGDVVGATGGFLYGKNEEAEEPAYQQDHQQGPRAPRR